MLFRSKGAWIIIITYRLAIQYITEFGFKHTAVKTVEFEKVIPFPLTCDHGMIDFAKTAPYLFVGKVDCIETRFKNIDGCAVIEAFVKLETEVVATIKNALGLLTSGPVC